MSAEPNYTFGFNAHHVAAALNVANIRVGDAPPFTWRAVDKRDVFSALYGGNAQAATAAADPHTMSVHCENSMVQYGFLPGLETGSTSLFAATSVRPGFVVTLCADLIAAMRLVAPEIIVSTDPAPHALIGLRRAIGCLRRVAAACAKHGSEIDAVAQAMQRQRFAELFMVTKSDYMRHAGIDPAQLEG